MIDASTVWQVGACLLIAGGISQQIILNSLWATDRYWAEQHGFPPPIDGYNSFRKKLIFYAAILRFNVHLRKNKTDYFFLCLAWAGLVLGPVSMVLFIILLLISRN